MGRPRAARHEFAHVALQPRPFGHVARQNGRPMAGEENIPSVETITDELGKLLSNRTPSVTMRLAKDMRSTLSLYVLGGPQQPRNKDEAAERVELLWVKLREFLEWNFADEISNDRIVETEQATPEEWAKAARLVWRFGERGQTWHCGKYSDNFPELQEKADEIIRKGVGSDTSFRKKFQEPICKALARLLRKAEEEHRNEIGV